MKNSKCIVSIILFLMFFRIYPIFSYAKTKTEIIKAEEIGDFLVGEGVTISNVKTKGYPSQIGRFEGANYVEEFENLNDGVILTTGTSVNVFGPEKTYLCGAWNSREYNGDEDLEEILAGTKNAQLTHDAVSIEFDAVSDSDYISFQYVFASEEFDQPDGFNDTFALYVNGENIAKIPGTKDTVSMVSLRNKHRDYYHDNKNGENLGFLGYSVLLSCQANVKAGETNRLKLVIADVGDNILDSAIFIKAHSISSKKIQESEENPNIPEKPEKPEEEEKPSQDPTPTPTPTPPEKVPYPLVVEQEFYKIRLYTANGNMINSIELRDGKTVGKLKDAFIADSIYLIADNEIIQGARIEVECKIRVKNNSVRPCEKLVIQQKLGGGLVCDSKGWECDVLKEIATLKVYGDRYNPAIEPFGTFEATMEASRLLGTKEYEFQNSAIAYEIDGKIQGTSEPGLSEIIRIIPPFGQLKKSSMAFIIIMGIGIVFIISWKLYKKK